MRHRSRARAWAGMRAGAGTGVRRRARAGMRTGARAGMRAGSRCRMRAGSGRGRMRRGRLRGMRLRLMRLRGGSMAGSFRRRIRRLHRLVLMLSGIFGIVLGFLLGDNFVLHGRLVLNKLDIRHLRSRRRRHYKKESQNEAGEHQRKVEYVRAGSCLRHLYYIFRIYLTAVNHSRVVVGIARSIGNEGENQSDVNDRNRRAEMRCLYGLAQNHVGLHVIGHTEIPE